MTEAPKRIVFLMRGLPSTGKSHMAQRLAGTDGIVLETDSYFETRENDGTVHYNYREDRLNEARGLILQRLVAAIAQGVGLIVLDRGNGANAETARYVRLAVESGYRVELREPDSLWWIELRVLLKYRQHLDPAILDHWAEHLAERSRTTHRVPASRIRRWMDNWRWNITVEDILEYDDRSAGP